MIVVVWIGGMGVLEVMEWGMGKWGVMRNWGTCYRLWHRKGIMDRVVLHWGMGMRMI